MMDNLNGSGARIFREIMESNSAEIAACTKARLN